MSVQSVARYGWQMCAISFGMVMRFLGRYPETARSYYKPPEDDPHHHHGGLRHEHGIHSLLDLTYSHFHPQQQTHHDDAEDEFPRGSDKDVAVLSMIPEILPTITEGGYQTAPASTSWWAPKLIKYSKGADAVRNPWWKLEHKVNLGPNTK
ncbi:hypothetical protein R1sor_026126 [Riccia sorocarpa]|uniref:Uncharacterized protein n=1 Tax=Riccia sorocarpa TaxID=122646 RepID=A0ABD3GB49_9MARC